MLNNKAVANAAAGVGYASEDPNGSVKDLSVLS